MEFEDQILFSIFGLPITAYALCLTLALGAGLLLYFGLDKKRRAPSDALWTSALLSIPFGLIGGRLFYCIARFSMYEEMGFISILYLWDGGYALWGAVGGAALSALIGAKAHGQKAAPILDVMAPAGALTIGLGRFAEYFTLQGIGTYVENEALCFFPLAVYRESYDEWNYAVFMLEGLAALAILFVLLKKERGDGNRARLFLLLYSACQVLFESLRRDSVLRWLFVRVSQLTAALVIAGLMLFAVRRWARQKDKRRMTGAGVALCWAVVLACAGLCVAMEFSVDGKILEFIPVWAGYGVMALACVGMGCASYRLVFKSLKA
ncbi:MAG: prolipoprotein diacylglyceryl transferase [Clostridia bacterium]|nr:prolipoprotein diacylglyceryl transferase [Clostridia bacterium]